MNQYLFEPHVLLPLEVGKRTADHPYLSFCIDDCLSPEVDHGLCSTFPDDLILESKKEGVARYLSLSDGSFASQDFLNHNPIWSEYVSTWRSSENLRHCLLTFHSEFRKRYWGMWRWVLSKRLRNLRKLEVTITLAIYTKGFHLIPHSDDKYKLLSVIHYLPSPEMAPCSSGGTTFFAPRNGVSRRHLRRFSAWSGGIRRFFPIWMSPVVEASLGNLLAQPESTKKAVLSDFNRCFQQSFRHDYRKNRICGFVKNDWSMHEVDLTNFSADQLRRAVLINVRLKPSPVSFLIPRIERWMIACQRKFSKSVE